MKPSVLEMRNAFYGKLAQVSRMVDSFETKNPSAVSDWINWLKEAEDLCQKYNLADSAGLAGYRSAILHECSLYEPGANAKRKRIFSKALETIQPAQAICAERFKKLDEKIETVRSLIRQILVPAKEAGCIRYDPLIDFTSYIESLLQQFRQHEQLAAGVNGAIALVGKRDVILILAEEVDFS